MSPTDTAATEEGLPDAGVRRDKKSGAQQRGERLRRTSKSAKSSWFKLRPCVRPSRTHGIKLGALATATAPTGSPRCGETMAGWPGC